MIVEKSHLGLVGSGDIVGVVLPAHCQQRLDGINTFRGIQFDEVVLLAAQCPDDVARLPINEEDGVDMANRNKIVSCFSLDECPER